MYANQLWSRTQLCGTDKHSGPDSITGTACTVLLWQPCGNTGREVYHCTGRMCNKSELNSKHTGDSSKLCQLELDYKRENDSLRQLTLQTQASQTQTAEPELRLQQQISLLQNSDPARSRHSLYTTPFTCAECSRMWCNGKFWWEVVIWLPNILTSDGREMPVSLRITSWAGLVSPGYRLFRLQERSSLDAVQWDYK